jgi:hypothetical protein
MGNGQSKFDSLFLKSLESGVFNGDRLTKDWQFLEDCIKNSHHQINTATNTGNIIY